MNLKSIIFFFLILLVAVSVFMIFQEKNTPEAEKEYLNEEERDHEELIFLLQYIGRDYQFAVENGVVINEFEYREMLTFCQRAIELYVMFQENLHQNLTLFQLQELREMVYQKVDRYAIRELTKTLVRDLTKELNMKVSPAAAPDIEGGRHLYIAGGCGVCHGESGGGDGRAAAWLEPGPGSFREPAGMNEATPYQFFNATRLGVAGTAMPSYREAFSEQELWDMAFYLMTLREDFNPRLTGDKPDITLEDLATKSNVDLMQEIMDRLQTVEQPRQAGEASVSAAIDFLRSHPQVIQ